jgi:glycosyltransferase involved in cell wall biosynthesis
MPYDELMRYFQKSAIAVLPSKWGEPFGRVVLEALSMGCATITSKCGAVPEITKDAALILQEVSAHDIIKLLNQVCYSARILSDFQMRAKVRAKEFLNENFPLVTIDNIRDTLLADD